MSGNDSYDLNELNDVILSTIEFFKGQLANQDDKHLDVLLPHPTRFRYLHEYEEYDGKKGGILIVGFNPHVQAKGKNGEIESENDREIWKNRYEIGERNTSDLLLNKYPYFSLFTTNAYKPNDEKNYSMNLSKIERNIKFTDVVLIRTSSKKVLLTKCVENQDVLDCLIQGGWEWYLRPVIELTQPKIIVSNSADLSLFLEREFHSSNDGPIEDVIQITLNGSTIPVVLSGQVTGQRAIDKWTLVRMRQAIITNL